MMENEKINPDVLNFCHQYPEVGEDVLLGYLSRQAESRLQQAVGLAGKQVEESMSAEGYSGRVEAADLPVSNIRLVVGQKRDGIVKAEGMKTTSSYALKEHEDGDVYYRGKSRCGGLDSSEEERLFAVSVKTGSKENFLTQPLALIYGYREIADDIDL